MTKSFQLNIVVRVTLICALAIATGFLIANDTQIYNAIALFLMLIILIFNLIWYFGRVHRRIAYFFDAVQNDDYSLAFPETHGDKMLNKLNEGLNRINNHIERVRVETIQHEKYFEAMIEHINVGIMSINSAGFVVNANSTIKRMLKLNQLNHIRQVESIDPKLASTIDSIDINHEKIVTISIAGEVKTMLVKSSQFTSREQQLKLVSMHDIRKELDEKELDSWLKLIRVLTHEIMNSIAPVTSLSDNLCSYYIRNGNPITVGEVNEKLISNTIQGLQVIKEQGQGLTRFVDNYRKLTRVPKPDIKPVFVKSLFEKSLLLYKSHNPESAVSLSYKLASPDIQVEIDENQILQVLTNLLNNSSEALINKSDPYIHLLCQYNQSGQVEISVTDNGVGIPEEIIDEIFIPFYTTRENGTGIGLSISRQIMRMHSGNISVKSIPNIQTAFTLTFKGYI